MQHSAEQFISILEKVAGEALFYYCEDGSLETVVHTGRMLEAFELKVNFTGDTACIVTELYLCADYQNRQTVQCLLDSLNKMNNSGIFFVSEENRISFELRISLKELAKLDNPFDAVFYGCEIFGKHQELILKALVRQHVYFIRTER